MTHILSKQSIKDFKNYIINGSNDLGIKVADHQADLMILHAKELMAWNKKINLTACGTSAVCGRTPLTYTPAEGSDFEAANFSKGTP